jgi:acyl carrier protein
LLPWSARPGTLIKLELAVVLSRSELVDHILEVIQSEIQDQTLKITLDMPIDRQSIDSIDVVNILFRLEDEYKVTIDLDTTANPETVGDLINALIEFIPHTDDPK